MGRDSVANGLFRRELLGPTVGSFLVSVCALLLIETVAMQFVVPYFAFTLSRLSDVYGRFSFLFFSGLLNGTLGYWGFGTVFALPALLDSKRGKIQANKTVDVPKLLQALPLIFFNFCIAMARLLRDIVGWFVVEEIMFFYLHRWMHQNKTMYQAVHKLHHTWTAPVSYVAMYCHPLEQILCNILPFAMGPILCGSHLAPTGIYFFAGMIHTTAVHSGYWFCDDNGMHDEHHAKFNVNFGVTGILDVLYGTCQFPHPKPLETKKAA